MAILPSFNDINYFLEVTETKNISRAAERLGITQPSLSSAIKRLEDSLGTDLLIRSRSGVQLTKAGSELSTKGRLLLLNWEQLKSEINRRQTSVTGEYVLGCHPSVALYTLTHFLPRLMNEFPELEIKLNHDLSRKITEGVISYQNDFGIVVNPVKHPDLVIKELCKDEVTFWKSTKKSNVSAAKDPGSVLIYDPNLNQAQKLIQDLLKQKIKFSREIHSTSLEVIRNLTMEGAGVGILPTRVALHNDNSSLKKIAQDAPVFKDRICLIFRADSQRTKSRQIITQYIQEGVSS